MYKKLLAFLTMFVMSSASVFAEGASGTYAIPAEENNPITNLGCAVGADDPQPGDTVNYVARFQPNQYNIVYVNYEWPDGVTHPENYTVGQPYQTVPQLTDFNDTHNFTGWCRVADASSTECLDSVSSVYLVGAPANPTVDQIGDVYLKANITGKDFTIYLDASGGSWGNATALCTASDPEDPCETERLYVKAATGAYRSVNDRETDQRQMEPRHGTSNPGRYGIAKPVGPEWKLILDLNLPTGAVFADVTNATPSIPRPSAGAVTINGNEYYAKTATFAGFYDLQNGGSQKIGTTNSAKLTPAGQTAVMAMRNDTTW